MKKILKVIQYGFAAVGFVAAFLFLLVLLIGLYHNKTEIFSFFQKKPTPAPTSTCKFLGCGAAVGCPEGEGKWSESCGLASNVCQSGRCTTPTQNNVQGVTTDKDSFVDCQIDKLCGGGTKSMRLSACNASTCCGFKNGSWILYSSIAACKEAQSKEQNQGVNKVITESEAIRLGLDWNKLPAGYTKATSNRSSSIQQNTVKTSGNNFYCWNNAYGYAYYTSSGDQCNLDNLKSSTYQICIEGKRMKADSCNSACENKADEDRGVCAWAYTGQDAGIEQNTDLYGECLNGQGGVAEKYAECLSACTNQYGEDIKQCK